MSLDILHRQYNIARAEHSFIVSSLGKSQQKFNLIKPSHLANPHHIFPSIVAWELLTISQRITRLARRCESKLPIFAFMSTIISSVCDNNVTILQADTGSGKRSWQY
jgi:hypothetical protein